MASSPQVVEAGKETAAIKALGAFDPLDPPEMEKILDCVHCGFCLPTCPTYLVLGNEMDSPRGRLYLMRAAGEGRVGIGDSFAKHMSLCLVCRACETACPSGVQFGALMEAARGQVVRKYSYSASDRLLRKFVLGTFTNLSLLRLLPALPDRSLSADFPEVTPAVGPRRGRVALLLGCAQQAFFPDVNLATARVLAANGFEVVAPRGQGCCGSLLVHEGEREQGKALARKSIDVFEAAGADLVAINAAGCGSVMKDYGDLLKDDSRYAGRAAALSRRVRDVSQILAEAGLTGTLHPVKLRVAYHDA